MKIHKLKTGDNILGLSLCGLRMYMRSFIDGILDGAVTRWKLVNCKNCLRCKK